MQQLTRICIVVLPPPSSHVPQAQYWCAAQLQCDDGALRIVYACGNDVSSFCLPGSTSSIYDESTPIACTSLSLASGECASAAGITPHGALLVGTVGGRVLSVPRSHNCDTNRSSGGDSTHGAHNVIVAVQLQGAVRQLVCPDGDVAWALTESAVASFCVPTTRDQGLSPHFRWGLFMREPHRFCILRPVTVPLFPPSTATAQHSTADDVVLCIASASPAIATFRAQLQGGPASLGELAVAAWRSLEVALPATVSTGVQRLYASLSSSLLRRGMPATSASAASATRLLTPLFEFADSPRQVTALVPDPSGRWLLVADAVGRVMLLDADLLVIRLWKGYRGAQVGWAMAKCAGRTGPLSHARLAVVIYAPRRRQVELWPPAAGPRIAAIRVDHVEGDEDFTLVYAAPPADDVGRSSPVARSGHSSAGRDATRVPRTFLLKRVQDPRDDTSGHDSTYASDRQRGCYVVINEVVGSA